MNARIQEIARTLPAVVTAAAVIAGSFAGVEWLRTAGCLGLGAFVALAILHGRIQRVKEAVSPWTIVMALGLAVFFFLAPLLPHASLDVLTAPILGGGLAGLAFLLGRLVHGLLRPNADQ